MPHDSRPPDLPPVEDAIDELEEIDNPRGEDRVAAVRNALQDIILFAEDFMDALDELIMEPIIPQAIFHEPPRPAGRFVVPILRPPNIRPGPYLRPGMYGRRVPLGNIGEMPRPADVRVRPAGLPARPMPLRGNIRQPPFFGHPQVRIPREPVHHGIFQGPEVDFEQAQAGPAAMGAAGRWAATSAEPDRPTARKFDPDRPAATSEEPDRPASGIDEPDRLSVLTVGLDRLPSVTSEPERAAIGTSERATAGTSELERSTAGTSELDKAAAELEKAAAELEKAITGAAELERRTTGAEELERAASYIGQLTELGAGSVEVVPSATTEGKLEEQGTSISQQKWMSSMPMKRARLDNLERSEQSKEGVTDQSEEDSSGSKDE